jgi:hypothetical protein
MINLSLIVFMKVLRQENRFNCCFTFSNSHLSGEAKTANAQPPSDSIMVN